MAFTEIAERFIDYLLELSSREDRGALAVLKRSLAFPPGTYPRAFPIVEPWARSLSESLRRTFYLVAGLFAHHQKHASEPSFPQAFAHLRLEKNSESLEARFLALLEVGEDELPVHLRRAVFLLREMPFNWKVLLLDLSNWWRDDRAVQLRWAREFYEKVSQKS